jgi:hypothetical protein
MTHERAFALLDDYAGGELTDFEAAAVRRHVDGCESCRREADALAALLAEAAALPRGIAPPRDLWDGIESRLETRAPAAEVIALHTWRRQPPAWLLAAAAVLLVVASSFATLEITGRLQPAEQAPVATGSPPPMTAFAAFAPSEREYTRAIEDLHLLLDTRRETLAPETVAVLEENLRIIDDAIRQTRAALEADPNSRELAQILSSAYDTKLDVLERAVQL